MSEPTVPPPPSYTPPPPPPPPPSAGGPGYVSPNRNLMIVLSYLWLGAVIPLVVEKDDKEIQWHAKHGLVLLMADIVVLAVIGILSHFVPCFGCVVSGIVFAVICVVHIMAIMKGVNGQRLIIPGLSEYADRF
jgi:uncharacterized membrane protein